MAAQKSKQGREEQRVCQERRHPSRRRHLEDDPGGEEHVEHGGHHEVRDRELDPVHLGHEKVGRDEDGHVQEVGSDALEIESHENKSGDDDFGSGDIYKHV